MDVDMHIPTHPGSRDIVKKSMLAFTEVLNRTDSGHANRHILSSAMGTNFFLFKGKSDTAHEGEKSTLGEGEDVEKKF